ncbi:MAG: hypothetical protein ABSH44_15850 [Bryobacteraceae bacterium]|jgi:hypothetical protein
MNRARTKPPNHIRCWYRATISADTSTWIAFLEGDGGEDAELLDRPLQDRQVLVVPGRSPTLPASIS